MFMNWSISSIGRSTEVLAEHSFDRLLLLIAIPLALQSPPQLASGHSADAEKSLFRYASEPFFSD
jgi:hypothetical protein